MASNEFVKKPGMLVGFTPADIQELNRCKSDPVYFISNYCYIQNQTLGKVKFALRPYQERIIRSLHKNRFNMLMIGRQSGKTETTAAYAFWFATFKSDKNVLVASNKQKGATDIMNRIRFMYENCPDFLRAGVNFYNRGSIEFDNGSKIWSEATTETTGRGRSLALFICDELAHVPPRIQHEMWASILPTISANSDASIDSEEGLSCIIMSTPNGDTDLFAELWRQAEAETNGFKAIFVPLEEVPGRDEAWCKMMESKMGKLTFDQEFRCKMLSSDPLLISSLVLTGMTHKSPILVDKGFAFWKKIDPNKTYLVGSDVAEGVMGDFSTIEVFELDTLEQVAEFRSNAIKENQLYEAIKWIIIYLVTTIDQRTGKKPTVYWSFENNSAGAAIGALYYADERFPPDPELLNGREEKLGFRTTNKAKLEACRHFKNLIEKSSGYKINSERLIVEMKNYVRHGASYAAKTGSTDDLVSAMLIITRMIKWLSEQEPEVFDKLYSSDNEFYDENSSDFFEPPPMVISIR